MFAVAFVVAAGEKDRVEPELTINQIMVQAHLTPMNRGTRNNLDSKVIDGKATDEEKQQLLDLYQRLSRARPPKGDLNEWKKRTGDMVAAVKAVIKGEEKAAERLAKARDCKACHAKHRSAY
jgi:hypothetical protein